MANSADSDRLTSSEANWSGSTLFAKTGYIRAQQAKGNYSSCKDILVQIKNFIEDCIAPAYYNVKTNTEEWELSS